MITNKPSLISIRPDTDAEKVLRQAINVYGANKQLLVAAEELGELQHELLKNVNRGKQNRDAVIDEFVDVQITLLQVKTIFAIKDEEINAVFDHKIARLERGLQ